ncbi:MAG: G8 domain-containing protein [Gemmatimonadota bacterium]|nr:G8 domain-containing protein [Gemmatimonadota bacterium]
MRQLSRRHGLTGLALVLAACNAADKSPTGPGGPPAGSLQNWSDPATWPSGQVPVTGDSVVIPAGLRVRLDTSPPALHSLTIAGDLVFGSQDISLTTGWILLDGLLQVGSEQSRYTHRALITLTGTTGNPSVSGMGNKVLGVNGTIELHGESRAGWTQLSQTAAAGATTIDLAQNLGWRIGDRIALASSDYNQDKVEEAVVAAVSGVHLTLAAPLRYSHYGQVLTINGTALDERAEVGLLSRNITIQGDTGTTPGYGGHIMVMAGATAHIEGVELFQMGQRGLLARYPMHWHVAGDVTGQYFRNNSVWRTFNRCVTIHGSDNATVKDNVCYDHTGHGYFLEDGAESGNLIEHNLGFFCRVPQGADRLLASDSRPATFWLTNPDNTVRGNHAAGSRGFGFWYAFPAAPTGLSVGQPDLPRTTPLREFSGNVAHSNHSGGLNVDDGPKMDGTTEVTSYAPRIDPASSSAAVEANFTGFLGYKHYGRAVWFRGDSLTLSNSILADNAIGATFAASNTRVINTLFIGQSGAIAALPSSTVLRGYEFYDGRVWADQVTFVNYTAATTVPASALGYNRTNAFPIDPLNFGGRMTFVNANEAYLENPLADKDGDKAAAFLDQNGDITGTAGRWVVANSPILVTGACTFRSSWNAHVCSNRFANLSFNSSTGEAVTPATIQRDDAVALQITGTGGGTTHGAMTAIPGRAYSVQWTAAAPASPNFYLNSAAAGDVVSLAIPYASAPSRIIRDYYSGNPMSATASKAVLDASTAGDLYYYDTGTTTLYLKFVVMAGRDWATLFVRP